MLIDYKKEGRIAIFTIDRPEAFNSMNMQALQELHDVMVDFRDNTSTSRHDLKFLSCTNKRLHISRCVDLGIP